MNSSATVMVTGANSGLGLELSRRAALRGCTVLMACRDLERGEMAAGRVRSETGAIVHLVPLDLADMNSIQACAELAGSLVDGVNVLVNNAGVMLPDDAGRLVHGSEFHLGVNFLGHFALTAALWPLLMAAGQPRIVQVTSMAARFVRMRLDEVDQARGMRAYSLSKLASLLFAVELARRASPAGVRSIACQPGYVATPLQRNMALARIGNPLLAQPVSRGVTALEMAAFDDSIASGTLLGPRYLLGMRGPVELQAVYAGARDADLAGQLWRLAQARTQTTLPVPLH